MRGTAVTSWGGRPPDDARNGETHNVSQDSGLSLNDAPLFRFDDFKNHDKRSTSLENRHRKEKKSKWRVRDIFKKIAKVKSSDHGFKDKEKLVPQVMINTVGLPETKLNREVLFKSPKRLDFVSQFSGYRTAQNVRGYSQYVYPCDEVLTRGYNSNRNFANSSYLHEYKAEPALTRASTESINSREYHLGSNSIHSETNKTGSNSSVDRTLSYAVETHTRRLKYGKKNNELDSNGIIRTNCEIKNAPHNFELVRNNVNSVVKSHGDMQNVYNPISHFQNASLKSQRSQRSQSLETLVYCKPSQPPPYRYPPNPKIKVNKNPSSATTAKSHEYSAILNSHKPSIDNLNRNQVYRKRHSSSYHQIDQIEAQVPNDTQASSIKIKPKTNKERSQKDTTVVNEMNIYDNEPHKSSTKYVEKKQRFRNSSGEYSMHKFSANNKHLQCKNNKSEENYIGNKVSVSEENASSFLNSVNIQSEFAGNHPEKLTSSVSCSILKDTCQPNGSDQDIQYSIQQSVVKSEDLEVNVHRRRNKTASEDITSKAKEKYKLVVVELNDPIKNNQAALSKYRKLSNFEEALKDLEDICIAMENDEDLFDRAERRDLPTIHQELRWRTQNDTVDDQCDSLTLNQNDTKFSTQPRYRTPSYRRSGVIDKISDDMAFRKLHVGYKPKKTSNKSLQRKHTLYSSTSCLDVSNILFVKDNDPDLFHDDVQVRNIRDTNMIKVIEPQPKFGIPLGPISGGAISDYLHAVPSGRYRSKFNAMREPDLVKDDLAVRHLRKDENQNDPNDLGIVKDPNGLIEPRMIWPPKKNQRASPIVYHPNKNNKVMMALSNNLANKIRRQSLKPSASLNDIVTYQDIQNPFGYDKEQVNMIRSSRKKRENTSGNTVYELLRAATENEEMPAEESNNSKNVLPRSSYSFLQETSDEGVESASSTSDISTCDIHT